MNLSKQLNEPMTKEYLNSQYNRIFCCKEFDRFDVGTIVTDSLVSLIENVENSITEACDKKLLREFVAEKLFEELEKHTPDVHSAGYLEFSKKVDAFLFCYKLFLNVTEDDFDSKELYEKICKCKNNAKSRKDFSFLPQVIVSLTSFPGRIEKIYQALNSVFTQTFKPDRIILWLAEEQFPTKELPQSLTDYTKLGLEIRWCKEDLRSHKKYFYVMQENPKSLIIVVDDDLIYDSMMVETLVTSYLHFPYAVSAARTHLMKMGEDGKIAPYMQWGNEFSGILGKPSMQLFSTSGAGTLYPPECMDKELFNMENIRLLAPNADDLWFKIMQVKKGTPVVLAKRNEKLVYVPGSQEIGLRHDNRENHGNDIQLAKLLSVYDTDGDLLKEIFKDNYSTDSCVIGVDIVQNNDYGLLDSVGRYLTAAEKAQKENNLLKNKNTELNKRCNELKQYTDDNFVKDYYKYKKESEILSAKLTASENKNKKLSAEIKDIKSSLSFKAGRIITFVPRKLRGAVRCLRDNGLVYTIKRIVGGK